MLDQATTPTVAAGQSAQHVLLWEGGKIRASKSLNIVADTHARGGKPGTLAWIDLQGPPMEYKSFLARILGLSRLVLEVITEDHERSRLVEGNGYYVLIVHGLAYNSETEEASTPRLDIIFTPTCVFTLHRQPMDWLDSLRESVRNDASSENLMSRGMPLLLHGILDALVDSYFGVLDVLDDLIDELENVTVTSRSNTVQQRLFRLKRALVQMRRVIGPQVEVTTSLVTRTGEMIPTEDEPYFLDVHDHLVRAFEVIDSYRDLMSGLLDVYLTTVSNRLNVVMKQLAIIATIFMPITFLTGVFGQNFGHMPQVEHDAGWNFWIVLLVMALITAGQLYYFRKRGWLGE